MFKVREKLFQLQDLQYKNFHSRLCPGVENIIGVRLPLVKQLAKKIVQENDGYAYLKLDNLVYYEELMLQGLLIGYLKIEGEQLKTYIEYFVPKINNWAICDSFCGNLKVVGKNQAYYKDAIQGFLKYPHEFEVRFAVVMLLDYYISQQYIKEVLAALATVKHDGYYVKMAVAWAISICFIKFPDETLRYLEAYTFDSFTHNKAIQKIRESYRVTPVVKEELKKLKVVTTKLKLKNRKVTKHD